MVIRTEINTNGLVRGLDDLGNRGLRTATLIARTKTVVRLRDTLNAHITSQVRNPVRFTRTALRAKIARRSDPVAEVRFKDLNYDRHYLSYLEEGGPRRHKGLESVLIRNGRMTTAQYLVPGDEGTGAVLDRHGNIVRRVYNVIISDLKAQQDRAANSTRASRRARRAVRRRTAIRGTFFIIIAR